MDCWRGAPGARCASVAVRTVETGATVPRALVVAEWDDGQDPSPSRKRPGSYSPATRLPGSSRKAGEMTVKPATEEDVAELTGRPVPRQPAATRRPLQRGDNPFVDALDDILTRLVQRAVRNLLG